ncbi:MAG: transposase [Pseudomonadota bacterium]
MPNYIRIYSGNLWFFTVVTHRRIPMLTSDEARKCLREAIIHCRKLYPFSVEAWVLLPDHLHCVWDLPESDSNYSRRWSIIKRKFTQAFGNGKDRIGPFWQKRFWAHLITDDRDYEKHMDYIHFNPVKHSLVSMPGQWPWTSLHCLVEEGRYAPNWGTNVEIPKEIGRE